ncbi:MAG: hypothetical protein K6E13_07135 [Lachnospiraceae bacterium]|nr:hypothetical protein [Lachnospiraceae bacterium]
MRCRRVPLEAEVIKYKEGCNIEDGFTLWADVITTEGYIVTDHLVKIKREDGAIVCPYISHHRGLTYINEDDYIIIDNDGTKHVCGEDKIFHRYEKI